MTALNDLRDNSAHTLPGTGDSSATADVVLHRLGLTPTPALLALTPTLIVTVAAWKGGTGKTELAKELGWLLGGVLVDLDWDEGGASRALGYRHETRVRAPLLDALEMGKPPRPLSGGGVRADLIPSHPDFSINQPSADHMATSLEQWSKALHRPLVVDTHPGGVPSTMGALSAAHVVVVPVNLETRALRATRAMAAELQGYPLVFIPNRVDAAPEPELLELEDISTTYKIPVGPAVYHHAFLKRRKLTMAVSAPGRGGQIPARSKQFVAEITAVARTVVELAAQTAS